MPHRWTIKEMESINTIDFAVAVLQERTETLTNPYAPLYKKIKRVQHELEQLIDPTVLDDEGVVCIVVREQTKTLPHMAAALRYIADLLDEGYSSGYYPTWELVGDVHGARRREDDDTDGDSE